MKTHKDLEVWKKSIDLVTNVYNISKSFPKEEIFGITSQIRRAAVSIPSNISEGAARNHKNEFIQFLYISLGSLSELETQLIICNNIGFLTTKILDDLNSKIIHIRSMLVGLIKSVKK